MAIKNTIRKTIETEGFGCLETGSHSVALVDLELQCYQDGPKLYLLRVGIKSMRHHTRLSNFFNLFIWILCLRVCLCISCMPNATEPEGGFIVPGT